MKKVSINLILMFVGFVGFSANAQKKWVDYAIKNNISIKQS